MVQQYPDLLCRTRCTEQRARGEEHSESSQELIHLTWRDLLVVERVCVIWRRVFRSNPVWGKKVLETLFGIIFHSYVILPFMLENEHRYRPKPTSTLQELYIMLQFYRELGWVHLQPRIDESLCHITCPSTAWITFEDNMTQTWSDVFLWNFEEGAMRKTLESRGEGSYKDAWESVFGQLIDLAGSHLEYRPDMMCDVLNLSKGLLSSQDETRKRLEDYLSEGEKEIVKVDPRTSQSEIIKRVIIIRNPIFGVVGHPMEQKIISLMIHVTLEDGYVSATYPNGIITFLPSCITVWGTATWRSEKMSEITSFSEVLAFLNIPEIMDIPFHYFGLVNAIYNNQRFTLTHDPAIPKWKFDIQRIKNEEEYERQVKQNQIQVKKETHEQYIRDIKRVYSLYKKFIEYYGSVAPVMRQTGKEEQRNKRLKV
ncbi:hypothetical protein PROFUN_00282 [Planoprotostelium fungivorum]|uniref:F-box domain-containing protein n=1 Tax=Planoprotostelium fungivorum TaxID=1890364 RepID=A0A2P6NXY1_9EUKA|nr:hypothetical protein PROFUN_00282 [Planoprotostelium fungivorum]